MTRHAREEDGMTYPNPPELARFSDGRWGWRCGSTEDWTFAPSSEAALAAAVAEYQSRVSEYQRATTPEKGTE